MFGGYKNMTYICTIKMKQLTQLKFKIMKDLKLSASRIDNQIMCFFYIGLTSNLDGNPEGKICVVNSNAGASLNQIAIDRNDIYLHKKGGNGVPDLISIPLSYIDKCEFSTF